MSAVVAPCSFLFILSLSSFSKKTRRGEKEERERIKRKEQGRRKEQKRSEEQERRKAPGLGGPRAP
jgi:hypothetical protein